MLYVHILHIQPFISTILDLTISQVARDTSPGLMGFHQVK